MTAADTRRPFFEIRDFHFRLWPILLVGLAIEPILMLGREPARWLFKASGLSTEQAWVFVLLACALQGVVGVVSILIMRRVLPQAEDNLRWPPGRSYAGLAFAIGIGMALVMFVADYAPEMVRGTPPDKYATDPVNAVGWVVGIASAPLGEETIFRGLLVGALAVLVPGRIRIGRIDLPVAAYLVALLFAVVHWRSFLNAPLHLAIAQQCYAIVWGLTYVWLMERSRSLLAPSIAHATGNAGEVSMVIVWRLLAGQ